MVFFELKCQYATALDYRYLGKIYKSYFVLVDWVKGSAQSAKKIVFICPLLVTLDMKHGDQVSNVLKILGGGGNYTQDFRGVGDGNYSQ